MGPPSRSWARPGVVIRTQSALPPFPLRGSPSFPPAKGFSLISPPPSIPSCGCPTSLDNERRSPVLRCPGARLPTSVHRSYSPPLNFSNSQIESNIGPHRGVLTRRQARAAQLRGTPQSPVGQQQEGTETTSP